MTWIHGTRIVLYLGGGVIVDSRERVREDLHEGHVMLEDGAPTVRTETRTATGSQ